MISCRLGKVLLLSRERDGSVLRWALDASRLLLQVDDSDESDGHEMTRMRLGSSEPDGPRDSRMRVCHDS
jgi:hypothetical protein